MKRGRGVEPILLRLLVEGLVHALGASPDADVARLVVSLDLGVRARRLNSEASAAANLTALDADLF